MKFGIFVEFYLCPLLGDKRLIFFPSIVMGGWAYQITKPPVCTNFNPFNHLKIISGRSTKMPNVIKVVGKRRMEKLLMGYQLNVVTPFHTSSLNKRILYEIKFVSSLPTSNWEHHWVKQSSARSDHWRRIAEYFWLRSSLRAKGNKGACDREGRFAGPRASSTQFHARVKVACNQHCWFGVVFSDQQYFYF